MNRHLLRLECYKAQVVAITGMSLLLEPGQAKGTKTLTEIPVEERHCVFATEPKQMLLLKLLALVVP